MKSSVLQKSSLHEPFFAMVYMEKIFKILFTLFICLSPSYHLISQIIAAGSYHIVLLDEDGHVWTFGYGCQGQLEHGNTTDQLVPKQIKSIKETSIAAMAAGVNYTVLLDKDGHVWTFGNGYYGQLGHGDTANQLVPKQVKEIPKIAVSAVNRFNKTKSARNI